MIGVERLACRAAGDYSHTPYPLQGYLAHKKQQLPGTLQQDYA